MVDIEQWLFKVLNLNPIFITIVFLECGVIIIRELGLWVQFVKDLGHVKALRVLLVAVPGNRFQISNR